MFSRSLSLVFALSLHLARSLTHLRVYMRENPKYTGECDPYSTITSDHSIDGQTHQTNDRSKEGSTEILLRRKHLHLGCRRKHIRPDTYHGCTYKCRPGCKGHGDVESAPTRERLGRQSRTSKFSFFLNKKTILAKASKHRRT